MRTESSSRRLRPKHLIHALHIPWRSEDSAIGVAPALQLAYDSSRRRRIQLHVHAHALRAIVCLCCQSAIRQNHGGERRIRWHGGRLNAPCERAFLRRSHDQRAKQQQKQPDHRRDSKRLPHSQALPCPTRIFYDTYAYYIRRRTARQVEKRRAERFPAVLAAFSKKGWTNAPTFAIMINADAPI